MQEKTLFLIKPDGVARGLGSEIISRVNTAGLKIIAQKQLQVSPEMAQDLYSPHFGKHFYPGLISFITSGPVIPMMVQGENAILKIRELMGATDPREARAGTIRGDLKEENIFTEHGSIKNIVHGSDSLGSAVRELEIFFPHPLPR